MNERPDAWGARRLDGKRSSEGVSPISRPAPPQHSFARGRETHSNESCSPAQGRAEIELRLAAFVVRPHGWCPRCGSAISCCSSSGLRRLTRDVARKFDDVMT